MKESQPVHLDKTTGGRRSEGGEYDARQEKFREEYKEAQEAFLAENVDGYFAVLQMIKQIDFSVISDIFAEYLRKSGVNPGEMNHADVYILRRTNSTDPMAYDPVANSVLINAPWLSGILHTDPSKELTKGNYVQFIYGIIHELTHTISAVRLHATEESGGKYTARMENHQVGFSKTVPGIRVNNETGEQKVVMNSIFMDLFNEGVTDMLAREVTMEYLHRAPAFAHDKTVLEILTRQQFEWKGLYAVSAKFVQSFVLKISEVSDVPVDVVWRGVTHAYFSGLLLQDPELASWIEQTFGKDFIGSLGSVSSTAQLEVIAKNAGMVPLSDELGEVWLARLQSNRGAA